MKPEEKLQVVLEGLRGDTTVKAVCDKYNISRDTYYRWKNELMQGACMFWEEQKPGRKSKDHFETRSEAEKAFRQLQEDIKQKDEQIYQLRKEIEGLKIQRDFLQFCLDLRSKKNSSSRRKNGSWSTERASS